MDALLNLFPAPPATAATGPGASAVAGPSSADGFFTQALLQQLAGIPGAGQVLSLLGLDGTGKTSADQTANDVAKVPELPVTLRDLAQEWARIALKSKGQSTTDSTQLSPDKKTCPSPKDISQLLASNPLLLAMLGGSTPAQTPLATPDPTSSSSTFQLDLGITGDPQQSARALQQIAGSLQLLADRGQRANVANGIAGDSKQKDPLEDVLPSAPAAEKVAPEPAAKAATTADQITQKTAPPVHAAFTHAAKNIPDTPAEKQSGMEAVLPKDPAGVVAPETSQSADSSNQGNTSTRQDSGHGNSESSPRKSAFSTPTVQEISAQQADTSPSAQWNVFPSQATSAHPSMGPQSQSVHLSPNVDQQPVSIAMRNALPANDVAMPRVVHEAPLMQAAGQSEMNVTLRTEASGTVNVKAVLDGNHLNASVASPVSETRDWMVNNLHQLHADLSRDSLNLRSFEVTDSFLQNGWNSSHGNPQDTQQEHRRMIFDSKEDASITNSTIDSEMEEDASQALSLHA